jgi:molecular chaperone GrpE
MDEVVDSAGETPTGQSAQAAQAETGPEPVEQAATEVDAVRQELERAEQGAQELTAKLKEADDRMMRALADLENYKKRAAKEREEIQRFGIEKLLRDFLPVADNLDRALEHAVSTTDFESLRQGLQMTRKQFEDALGKNGVKGFTSVGESFDPRFHEAMDQVETAEVEPGKVARELVRGYLLNDRLIRPALVAVARAPAGVEAGVAAEDSQPQGAPAPGDGSHG